jgi:hypothetical protein
MDEPNQRELEQPYTSRASVRRPRLLFHTRTAQIGGVSVMVACLILAACVGGVASAGTGVGQSGNEVPNSAVPSGLFTQGAPFSSGQIIDVEIPANSVLAPNSTLDVLECADPSGTTANLPTSNATCDGNTNAPDNVTSNSDGSVDYTPGGSQGNSGYPIYALPNKALGESANGQPVCNLNNPCVLYVGQDSTNFSAPHFFSQPFWVDPNGGSNLGANPGDGSQPAATPPSASASTVSGSATNLVADGKDVLTVTVTLLAANTTAVSGKTIVLADSTKNADIAPTSAITDPNGVATFDVTDSTPETDIFTATDTTDSLTILQTATAIFAAPIVDVTNSNVVAIPTAVPADGVTASTITVHLSDQAVNPSPVAGKTVTLNQGEGHSTIGPPSAVTDSNGTVTFTVTDTTNEAVTYTAMDSTDGIALTRTVIVAFGTVSVSPTASTVAGETLARTGTGGVAVTVTLLAANGQTPIANKSVTLAAESGESTISPATPVTTDASGQAAFSVSDTTAETVTYVATDATDGLTLAQKITIQFEVAAPSATRSTVSASATSVPADGQSPVVIGVDVVDQFGAPLAGQVISVAPSAGSFARLHPITVAGSGTGGTTNSTGLAEFEADDEVAESVTFTAVDTTANNLALAQAPVVTFVAGSPDATKSAVVANPTGAPADGKTPVTITVTLDDHFSNPIPGKAVLLAALAGSSIISPSTAVMTNSAGQAVFTVTDTANEIVTYEATDQTDGLTLEDEAVSVAFGTPPPPVPAQADSTIVASSVNLPADGSSASTITVELNDLNGNPVIGKLVSLTADSGSSKITAVSDKTDGDGDATFNVSDSTAEVVTYTAVDTTDDLALAPKSVTVTFTASALTTTTTTSTTTTTTTTASTTSTSAVPPTSSSVSSAGTTASVASPSLAFTGAGRSLIWLFGLGFLLLIIGTIGRRFATRRST